MKKKKEEAPTIEDEARRFLANVNRDLENGFASDGECKAFAEVLRICMIAGLDGFSPRFRFPC